MTYIILFGADWKFDRIKTPFEFLNVFDYTLDVVFNKLGLIHRLFGMLDSFVLNLRG